MKLIEPKLRQRISGIAANDAEIGAVVTVQDLSPQAKVLSPEDTLSIVDRLVSRVQSVTGIKPSELRVQKNLGTFLVHAKPSFIRLLLDQDEVHNAASVDDDESAQSDGVMTRSRTRP